MSIATTHDPELAEEAAPSPDPQRPKLRAVRPPEPERTLRLTIDRIGVASAARTAALVSFIVGASIVATGALLWWAGRRAGLLGWFEDAIANGLGLETWAFPAGTLLLVWASITAVSALLAVAVVALLVVAFNQTGGGLGGIDVRATAQDVDNEE